MKYPPTLNLTYLESENCEYTELKELYQDLTTLVTGGFYLEKQKEKFLPKRPGEEQFIYEQRIKKFTYSNVLGSAISHQVGKLSAGTHQVLGLDSNKDFWIKFREDTNLKQQSEQDLINRIFREAFTYKKVFIHVDKPYVNELPKNKLQEELLGLRPYLVIYPACNVIDWIEDSGKLSMVKVRQVSEYRPTYFSKAITKVTWTIITDSVVLRYSALVKQKDGHIIEILDKDGESVAPVDQDTLINLESEVEHNLGEIPVIKFEIPSDLWGCSQAYLLAKEHLNLLNTRYDTASLAYVQRTYTPFKTPDADLSKSFIDEDGTEQILSGNPFIIKASAFDFKEMQGTSIKVLSELLDDIENNIREILSLNGVSADKKAVEQSGISKKLDAYAQESVMRAYGKLLCDFYQDVLQLVAKSAGLSTEISVTGFDKFELDTLDQVLITAEFLYKLKAVIPATAFKLFIQNLVGHLLPNLSSNQKEEIQREIEQIDFSNNLNPVSIDTLLYNRNQS
jgi:hypothetical protein